MKFRSFLLSLIALIYSFSSHAVNLDYSLSIPEAHTHYVEVKIIASDIDAQAIEFIMPTWTPGSYLIREFSRHVEGLEAKAGNSKLELIQTRKNRWKVNTGGNKEIEFSYRVYAFELAVRTSFVDASHAYLNGTSIFMYTEGTKNEAGSLSVDLPKKWKKITTALPKAGKNKFSFENFDQLADCPIEMGNHLTFEFTAAGVKHSVAMYGDGNYDVDRLKTDMAKIVEAATRVFGHNPNKEYTFIVHNLKNGGGGLEHMNSTTLQHNRWGYTGRNYLNFLQLVAHEYFHLWNVKRIRPDVLGPFDYENENYTDLLWVMEGFTSYYEKLIMYRAGFHTEDDLVNKLNSTLNYIENQPGNRVEPVAHASFNAWIKYYRADENQNNTGVSYYSKGAMLAWMIDLKIIKNSKGGKNLDDFMRHLYKFFYSDKKRGFTEEEFQVELEKFTGEKMDDFLGNYVYGTVQLPYRKSLGYAGLNFEDVNLGSTRLSLGLRMSGLKVIEVIRERPAYSGGVNVNDKVLAIKGYYLEDNEISDILSNNKPGDEVEVLLARAGKIMSLKLELEQDNYRRYQIRPKETMNQEESKILLAWLRK